MRNSKIKTIHVNEDFTALDSRSLDSKKRITLGAVSFDKTVHPIKSFQIYQNKEGDILLRPEVSIPAREAWIYENPKILASLKRGVRDAKEGKGDIVNDIDSYIENL